MISKVRLVIDIPIEHHSDADEIYIKTAVLEAIHNQKTSISSSDRKKSYTVMQDTGRRTEILPHDHS